MYRHSVLHCICHPENRSLACTFATEILTLLPLAFSLLWSAHDPHLSLTYWWQKRIGEGSATTVVYATCMYIGSTTDLLALTSIHRWMLNKLWLEQCRNKRHGDIPSRICKRCCVVRSSGLQWDALLVWICDCLHSLSSCCSTVNSKK